MRQASAVDVKMALKLNREQTGFLLTVVSAFAFSSKTILAKLAYQHGVDAVTILALRMIFAGALFAVILAYNLIRRNWRVNLSRRQWIWAVTLGVLGYYLSSLLDFSGLVYVDASLGRMILFLYPSLVVVINAALSRQAIRGDTWLALALCYGGIFLMLAPNLGGSQPNFWLGGGLIFAAALTYACYLVGVDRQLRDIDPALFTSLVMMIACLSVIVHFFLTSDVHLLSLPAPVLVNGFCMGALATVLPIYTLTAGIARIGASRAAVVSMFGPVLTLVMGFIFLNERLLNIQIAGMLLIMAGIWRMGK